jgi:5-methylcytosine-specific restriction endonuclease McrA
MRRTKVKVTKVKKKIAWNPHPYLVAAARRIWRWSPERREIANACAVGLTKRRCVKCEETKARKEVQIDHIVPVGKQPRSWSEYPGFYERLFCAVSNLQPLCKTCHTAKSNLENKARKEA